ncbi:MAG: preprotein translocase subunit YajC [Novosphingobium sp.]|nr:preprotein translocase subunit YajC [Novosphingobium sp.]
MLSRLPRMLAAFSLLCAGAIPLSAAAQTIAYGSVGDGGDEAQAGSSSDVGSSGRRSRGSGGGRVKHTEVTPYIEARQLVTAELSPGDDVLTYSVLAVGVDAETTGLRNAASLSLRYERRFGWGKKTSDTDLISGIARGYTTIMPGVQIEAGGLAERARFEQGGASVIDGLVDDDSVTQVYSVYAGPSVATSAGDVSINANYRFGYTKVEQPDAFQNAPDGPAFDVFDDSTIHAADVHAGVQPYEVLPVGLGAGASYVREDISNLDQRVEDFSARGDVTVPLSPTLAVVGGVGYEDVEISSRDVLRDGNGDPVIGNNGRYVTDKSSPRILAYDVDGLIWDAGVLWRPSPRTALEAHLARRYGSTSVYGTFAYTPNSRSSINIAVYDNVAGFGGQLNNALVNLPTEFTAVRNPLTGDIGSCVASLDSGTCLTGAFGSVRSSTFRARGVTASYAIKLNRIRTGIGAGYDRRKFIGAPGTILEAYNGVIEESYWLAAYLNGEIDNKSSFSTNLYANWFDTGAGFGSDVMTMGATAAYYRSLTRRLSATAALGIDGANRDDPNSEDYWAASALLGVRYSF